MLPDSGRGSLARLRCCVRAFRCAVACALSFPVFCLFAQTSAASVVELDKRYSGLRGTYEDALEAARKGDDARLDALYRALGDYPLKSYIDYERLLRRRHRLGGEDARAFIAANSDSPLGVRYLGHYLSSAGAARRWDDYLQAATSEPRSESLRCYYHLAQLAQGQRTLAFDGAARLWTKGRSADDACDPLFSAWRKAGKLDDEQVWERSLLAFDARQFGLLKYVGSLATPALQGDLELLRRSYREPQRTWQLATQASDQRRADIVTAGLVRLSRYDPARSLKYWQQAEQEDFTARQREAINSAIALRGLLEREQATRAWVDGQLGRWGNDRLTGLRLRWAIEEQDWQGLLELSQSLSADGALDSTWRYWRARALEELGRTEAANQLYGDIARERSYYGFLSADRVGLPYSFNEIPLQASAAAMALTTPGYAAAARVHELQVLGEARDAHAEWAHALPRVDQEARRQLAVFAAQAGWHRFAIDAANASDSSDAIALRFPLAYTDVFRAPAARESVPLSELMAIARRESAFFPDARSPVGARGLMQLMPATGLNVARRKGLKLTTGDLYDIEHNVTLGSAYYRQLLERFDGNRAVALAAYNAGPNRVKHWVGRGLPLDAWIETIPYGETRDYVKAVLAYSVVFDYRLGEDASLLSAAERLSSY